MAKRWPHSAQRSPLLAYLSPIVWPKLAKLWPNLADGGQTLTSLGQHRPIAPELPNIAQSRVGPDRTARLNKVFRIESVRE